MGSHECPDKTFTLVDEIMSGVVDRLYNLGIEPLTAMWSAYEISTRFEMFRCNATVELESSVYVEVLGDLPVNWHYFRVGGSKVVALEFADLECWNSYDKAKDKVLEVIKGFEKFLNGRDLEGTKAVLRLWDF